MKYLFILTACLLSLSAVTPTLRGDEPAAAPARHGFRPVFRSCPMPPGCPNDYDRKPFPCVAWACAFGLNDYCRKPLPCVQMSCNNGPDDYCRKSLPRICCPSWPSYFTCGSPATRCVGQCQPTPIEIPVTK